MRRLLLPIALAAAFLAAQTGGPAEPQFEVASIKANISGGWQYSIATPSGKLTMTNIPLSYVIPIVFGIQDWRVKNLPAWATDRYDIEAKAPGPANRATMMRMMQRLLADRFQFQYHRQTEDALQYALKVSKGGLKLKPSELSECSPGSDTVQGNEAPCGRLSWSNMTLAGTRATIPQLIYVVSQAMGRTVSDETGLSGAYDMTLHWLPEAALTGQGEATSNDSPMPIALQDQMGLTLEQRKGPVEMLVIDRLERPSAN